MTADVLRRFSKSFFDTSCSILPSPAGGRRVGDEGLARETVLANTLTPTLSRLRERERNTNPVVFVKKLLETC
jgi:hypothetical protein